MNEITKTITKIKLSPEELKLYEQEHKSAERQSDKIQSIVSVLLDELKVQVDILLLNTKKLLEGDSWVYMGNKDVYYIPRIVGIMPNLQTFDATYRQCSYSFNAPSVAQMSFAGFSGDFPTQREAELCFKDTGAYCISGRYVKVQSINHDGVTIKNGNVFACYNLYRGYRIIMYGYGESTDCGWNIPIFRFNGIDSAPVSVGETVLYWLKYDLRPAFTLPNKNSALEKAYNYLSVRKDFLIADGDTLILDTEKLRNAINSGKKIDWLPDEFAKLNVDVPQEGKSFSSNYKNFLLQCDHKAIALDAYDEKILTDPNRGHWDLWDKIGDDSDGDECIDLGERLTARNPVADVSDGIVAIDFGTKSTVVVCETDELQVLPLQVGSGTYGKGAQVKNYENPTVLQFIDIDSFIAAYSAKAGRPATDWNTLTVSHNAFQNLEKATSDKHDAFFDELKQWCGTSGQRLKLQDYTGKIWELQPFMELQETDVNPLEIYAYYLGRYINHMIRGKIFLHYVMSFPVTYEHRIRERMAAAIRRGLKKSLPTALLADEEVMKKFQVMEVASEPAAYAVTALNEYNFEPENDEKIYYAVFDFGGGTTDFDFGMFKESEEDRYDYDLIHFGENGDRTLGGENLLRLLAFEVFRANKDFLLNPDANNNYSGLHIPFPIVPDAPPFAEADSLIKNSAEAHKNIRNLMEMLRPVWEDPDSKKAKDLIDGGQIQLTLYREDGTKKNDANLKLKIGDNVVDLQAILRTRIETGIKRFFSSLAEAFDKSAGKDNRIAALSNVKEISVFLAGNSSKSPLVKELFEKYTATDGQNPEDTVNARTILKFGDEQPMPKFVIYPPLGTQEADILRNERLSTADTRDPIMRPTCKSGVAYGLLKCRDGGEIRVETITPDGERVPFQYYIGRRKKGKFRLVIDRNAKLKTWYNFIDAGGAFDILYTDRPEAAMGDAPMTIAKQKHISIEHPDKTATVYIRPVESRVIEYIIAHDENELKTGGVDKCDPIRIELE